MKLDITKLSSIKYFSERNVILFLFIFVAFLSVSSFLNYYTSGTSLAYNDARSHLDIGRRVVEGLKPGLAQLGSVWLPLPHLLMVPTIWSNFMWHSGLSGAIQSMGSYMFVSIVIFLFLRQLKVDIVPSIIGVLVFATNPNILYLQSTAMTELLLVMTMTVGVYEMMLWYKNEELLSLMKASFWIMLSTLIRYDGWFLLLSSTALLGLYVWRKYGFKTAQGMVIFFSVLAGFGVFLWFLWNLLIFKDPLYFAFGPYSAHAQQAQFEELGRLKTKGNLLYSLQIYFFAMVYNMGFFSIFFAFAGGILFWFDKKIPGGVRVAALALLAPFFFNILALFFGHSIISIAGMSAGTWFNVRYGIMMLPAVAILIGYLVHRLRPLRYVIIGLIIFISLISIINNDIVTLEDGVYGGSGVDVSRASSWLRKNAYDETGYILISAASHDSIIFSSGLPMSRFIHEGTGKYWDYARKNPQIWARWIVMKGDDKTDKMFNTLKQTGQLYKYIRVVHYNYADVYELRSQYLSQLITKPILGKQK